MTNKKMTNVLQMLECGQNDLNWFQSNLDKLRSQYNNKFIAFHNKEIILSDSNLKNLLERLKQKGIDTANVMIEFISKIKAIL